MVKIGLTNLHRGSTIKVTLLDSSQRLESFRISRMSLREQINEL